MICLGLIANREPEQSALLVITCRFCGEEILVVPDIKAMSKAIANHVNMHRQKITDPQKAASEAVEVRKDLLAKVLQVASRS